MIGMPTRILTWLSEEKYIWRLLCFTVYIKKESYTACSHKHKRDADIKINVAVAVFWQANLFVLTFRQMTALAGMNVLTVERINLYVIK